jgi:vacuolar-type H+-ATPase subunit H
MKFAAVVLCAFLLGACTQSDDEHAREQARQTAQRAKQDSRVALHDAEVGAKKAGKEIDRGLEETRQKVRNALNAHPADTRRDDTTRP